MDIVPDPDDAFMFWGLAAERVDARGFEFEHVLEDIQTLNEWALEGRLEVTAISLHAYPFVQDKYVILPHGASMGSGYGPVVVSTRPLEKADLREIEIAVPGRMTTAFLTLGSTSAAEFRYREVPFDQIMDEVEDGRADAGLLIHEGQLTYERHGLAAGRRPRRVVAARDRPAAAARDQRRAARPRRGRPAGALRRPPRLDRRRPRAIARRRSSTRCSTGAGSSTELADRFVGMYVNELTEDYGDEGRQAVAELLRRGEEAGAFERPGPRRVRGLTDGRGRFPRSAFP